MASRKNPVREAQSSVKLSREEVYEKRLALKAKMKALFEPDLTSRGIVGVYGPRFDSETQRFALYVRIAPDRIEWFRSQFGAQLQEIEPAALLEIEPAVVISKREEA